MGRTHAGEVCGDNVAQILVDRAVVQKK